MAWFDNATAYYRNALEEEPIGQGDILIAASSVIVPGDSESDIAGPSEIGEIRRSTLWHSTSAELPAAPSLSAETRWGLVMVIPHACAMEKEWNERVAELMKAGSTEEAALATATSESELDEYVSIAPLALYTSIPEWKHNGVRSGQRLGFFPVCASDVIPEAFVDFNKMSTVHFSLLPRTLRQGSLSDLALAHFQHALAMHFAYRGLSGLEKLEAAIGRQIVSVAATTRAKGKIIVNMALDNGDTVTLESVDSGANLRDVARPARS